LLHRSVRRWVSTHTRKRCATQNRLTPKN